MEKDGVFITSAIATVLVEKFVTLVNIAFGYSPAGVEILKPDREILFKPMELQSMLLDISQISLNYSRYVLERVLKPEDLTKITTQLENRALIGKRLMEKKEEKKEEGKK